MPLQPKLGRPRRFSPSRKRPTGHGANRRHAYMAVCKHPELLDRESPIDYPGELNESILGNLITWDWDLYRPGGKVTVWPRMLRLVSPED